MSEIKFDHAVIYGGVLYPANTPIKVEGETKAPKKKAGAKDNDNSGEV